MSRCTSCTLVFTNPRPPEKDSGRYYQSDAYISHSDSKQGLVNKAYRLVRSFALRKKARLIRRYMPTGHVLDIGSGTGHFLHTLQRAGFHVQGMEPGEAPRTFSKNTFGLDVASDLFDPSLENGAFDAVTMWHVLEHVYPLHAYLKRIHQLLKTDGLLFVAVPNPDAYDARHYQEFWAAYDLPRHLYHFTSESLVGLMQAHNFSLIKTLPMKFDGYYVSMLSEKYKVGKNNYVKAFFVGLKSNASADRQKNNYSSTIYILKRKKR
jgi:2-polyprenyl-3-methyl-5-hydroxy-6-metoxy-1,4-benzoquinol methylase